MLNHVRKLVLIPLEEWEKIKDKNMKEMKQVVVSLPAQEKVNTSPMSPTVKKSQSGKREYLSDTESNDEKHLYSKSDVQRFKSSEET